MLNCYSEMCESCSSLNFVSKKIRWRLEFCSFKARAGRRAQNHPQSRTCHETHKEQTEKSSPAHTAVYRGEKASVCRGVSVGAMILICHN